MARPKSTSPLWSSFDEDEDDEECDNWSVSDTPYRPTTAGSLGFRARTPVKGNSRPETPLRRAETPLKRVKKITLLLDRDKESMYEEIMKLSQAINDKAMVIKKQKLHASKLSLQNRKLEKNVHTLEMQGTKGPRTGNPSRLRAVVQGLRLKMAKFENLCGSQEEEIFQLERDLRVTCSKEMQIERDIYSGEFGRLHHVVKNLKKSTRKLMDENKEINNWKEKIKLAEQANERLEFSIQAVKGSVDKALQDMEASKQAADAAIAEAQEMNRLYNRIDEHKSRLERLVEIERARKDKLEKRMNNLSAMITRTEKMLLEVSRKKGVRMPVLTLRGGGSSADSQHRCRESQQNSSDSQAVKVTKTSTTKSRVVRVVRGSDGFSTQVVRSSSGSHHSRIIDQCAQTTVPRCPSPVVPRLDLGKLHTQEGAPHQQVENNHDKPEVYSRPPSRLDFSEEEDNAGPAAEERHTYPMKTKLETVSEDEQLHTVDKEWEFIQQQHTRTSQRKVYANQRIMQVRSQRDAECLEWLQELEVPDTSEPDDGTRVVRPEAYAEDTLQMTQLTRPAFVLELGMRPETRFLRRHHPP